MAEKRMPSLLEQILFRAFGERSDRGKPQVFEVLPIGGENMGIPIAGE